MNVGQLKALLNNYPEDMEVVNRRRSDWEVITEADFSIVKGVPNKSGGWIMRSHPTMNLENRSNEFEYLALEGN